MIDVNGPNAWYWEIMKDERHADIRRHLATGERREWCDDWYWFRGFLTQEEARELHRLAEGRAVLGGTTQ